MKLTKSDFNLSCIEMGHFLLGKVLVRKLENDVIIKGRIVETECYLGGIDKASHSFGGRRTARNEAMFMPAGTAYVYMTYGMYYCFNISSKELGAAVLIRSLEPIQGIEKIEELRLMKMKNRISAKKLKTTELCNGPSKLCIGLDIRKDNLNRVDLCENDMLWLEGPIEETDFTLITCTRIGIASCGEEWANKPLRFYIYQNLNVSKRDKKAEKCVESIT